jgi:hypothetical protein
MHTSSAGSVGTPANLRPLQHYESATTAPTSHGGVTPSSSTPHLSHLRHQSSMGFGGDHPDFHRYPTTAEGYDVYEEIGTGAFATVYHAGIHGTNEQVAIKVIDLDQFKYVTETPLTQTDPIGQCFISHFVPCVSMCV